MALICALPPQVTHLKLSVGASKKPKQTRWNGFLQEVQCIISKALCLIEVSQMQYDAAAVAEDNDDMLLLLSLSSWFISSSSSACDTIEVVLAEGVGLFILWMKG